MLRIKNSEFYNQYKDENKYYVDCVLKYVFNESISKVSNCKISGSKNYKEATYKQVVDQNCKVIGDFIEGFVKSFCKEHDYNEYEEIVKEIYLDPDDKFDYAKIKGKEFESIEFSYDGLVSINSILTFNEMILLDKIKFIEEYQECRSKPIFFFPSRQKNRVQTINMGRYSYFKDRIDYTLFDIKNYLDGKECIMKDIYENGDTKKWLEIVKMKGGFECLVKLYDIDGIFVKKESEDYKVIDIENGGKRFIDGYNCKTFIDGYDRKNYNWTLNYYDNLKFLIEKY